MQHVAYYRISKDSGKAGQRGLGLEAQQGIVQHFYNGSIVKEFTEIKSAKNITERPILQDAISYCLAHGYSLVVAKVDRLSRNVDDCRAILEQLKGRLIACDIPGVLDKFTLTLYATFAERERELISLRTSQALQAKIKREGSWQTGSALFKSGEAAKMGTVANKARAANNANNVRAREIIIAKRAEGLNFAQIAEYLNEKQFMTSRNKQFTTIQVQRLA